MVLSPLALFLLVIVLSVFLRHTASDYPFGIFKLLTIVLSVLLRFTASKYPFGIFKLLAIVFSVCFWFMASDYPIDIFKILAITLSAPLRCTASDLPLWYLQTCITILFTKVGQLYSSGNKRKLHLYYIRRKSLSLLPYSTVLIDIIIMTRWFPRNWCL